MNDLGSNEEALFSRELLSAIPSLRAFARSLGVSRDAADDLVQETMVKAWANRTKFIPGTNLKTWLFTILRNSFYSEYRRRKREIEDPEYIAGVETGPSQIAHLQLEDFKLALARVPEDQREALILVGAAGFTYDEAAEICGCPVGTIKSRVNRARERLAKSLDVDAVMTSAG
jgi:RNA polymerase sigma-70 factor (ECF subfamily)